MPKYFPPRTIQRPDPSSGNNQSKNNINNVSDSSEGFTSRRSTFWARMIVFITLSIVTSLCGSVSYYMLRLGEKKLFESQYHSLASEAVNSAVERAARMKQYT